MSIIAIIPSRYQSSRFPGKPLVDINGKSMIRRVWETAIKVDSIKRVIIATDDERIYNHVMDFGGEVMMTSSQHLNGTERIAEVLMKITDDYKAVLNIQGDEPFLEKEQIENLCEIIIEKDFPIATLAKKITDINDLNSPNTVKVVVGNNSNAIYFSRFPIPYNRHNDSNISYYKHIGMYAFKKGVLQELITLPVSNLERAESLEQLRWLEANYSIGIGYTDFESFGIDTPEDLKKALNSI